MAEEGEGNFASQKISRRTLLKSAAVGGLAVGAGRFIRVRDLASTSPELKRTGDSSETKTSSSSPRRGGTLKVGDLTGGTGESVNAQKDLSSIDTIRLYNLYDPLVYYTADGSGFTYPLAESIEANASGDEWTIRVKQGIEFHNGKTLGADDIKFTMQRIKATPYGAPQVFQTVIQSSYRALDSRTLRFKLTQPYAFLRDAFTDYTCRVVPVGYNPAKPVGTGPFRFVSFTPGRESVYTRFANYWQTGKPYLDELQILSLADNTALIDALLSGEIDVVSNVPAAQLKEVSGAGHFNLLRSLRPIQWVPFVMRCDVAPLSDVRVRQALRLLADRSQLVADGLSGLGTVWNDYQFCLDTYGSPGLPQREVDIEQAKSLLKSAGQEHLKLTLVTSPITPQAVGVAQIYAEQAAKGGVNVTIDQLDETTFYGKQFLTYHFTTDYWSGRAYPIQAGATLQPAVGHVYNETSWNDPQWRSSFLAAQRTSDFAKQRQYIHDCMRIEWKRGGYIIWGVQYLYTGASNRVHGLVQNAIEPDGSSNFSSAYLT